MYFGDEGPEAITFTDVLKGKIPSDILNEGSQFVFKWNYGKESEKTCISTEVMGYDFFF